MTRIKSLISLVAFVVVSGFFTITPHAAVFAHPVNTNPNQHLWHIVQLDASGHTKSTWTGSYAEYQTKIQQKLASQQPAVQKQSGIRPLINPVYDPACASRGDFYAFWNQGGTKICFANSGSLNTYFPNATIMNTGNNTGEFYDSNFYGYLCTPNPYTAYFPETGFIWNVTWVHIGGCPNKPYLIP